MFLGRQRLKRCTIGQKTGDKSLGEIMRLIGRSCHMIKSLRRAWEKAGKQGA